MIRACVACQHFCDLPYDRRRQWHMEMPDGVIRRMPDRAVGQCRADPPQLVYRSSSLDNEDTGVWPFVEGTAWCGRFAAVEGEDGR